MKFIGAEYCGKCRVVKRVLSELDHTVEILDINLSPKQVGLAGIKGVPALLLGDGSIVTGMEEIIFLLKQTYPKHIFKNKD